MADVDAIAAAVEPVVAALGLELYDVESTGPTRARILRVTVERPGGVDLDAVAAASQAISPVLDGDPAVQSVCPGPYTLEVTSPGLERRLRTPAHFTRAVGETVTLRVDAGTADVRRLTGTLASADGTGCTLTGPEVPGGEARISYDQIERARTVFEWGPAPRRAKSERVKRP